MRYNCNMMIITIFPRGCIYLKIALKIESKQEQKELEKWIDHHFSINYTKVPFHQESNLCFVEINQLFDWVKVRRIQRQQPNCFIIPIVHNQLTYTTPLALDLGLPYLLVKPFQKTKFIRAIKKAEQLLDKHANTAITYKELSKEIFDEQQCPFQDALLRRLIRGEIADEKEFLEARSLLENTLIPNTIIFIQGFSRVHNVPPSFDAAKMIKKVIQSQFASLQTVSFIHFNNYLILLTRVPDAYSSFKKWEDGTRAIERAISQLIEQHNTYIYVGIGNKFSKPLDLYKSYCQARKARKKPPVHSVHIRYYEELTEQPAILEAIQYIEQHCHEPINITDVAKYINFSSTHFGRLFKKETGRKFPEYVALTRIIMSLHLLRRSNFTVEKIAADFGFNTPNYYSSIFKKFVGLSPSEYRNTREIYFK